MASSTSPASEQSRRLRDRLLVRWPLKFAGTAAGMLAFFIGYFWVLHHPLRPVAVVPLTALDSWIGFHPAALTLYLSLWLYVCLAPALLVETREIAAYAAGAIGLSVVGLAIFLCWPTAVPAAGIDWTTYPALAFLKTSDASGNACPSLHVAFAVFTALWLQRSVRAMGARRRWHVANWAWCAGIVYSTLAIRQHVVLDVMTGAPLGAALALLPLSTKSARARHAVS